MTLLRYGRKIDNYTRWYVMKKRAKNAIELMLYQITSVLVYVYWMEGRCKYAC